MSNRSPIVLPLVLAVLVAVGFGMVWSILVFCTDEIISEQERQGRFSRQVYVATNGTPLVLAYSSLEGITSYATLEGKEISLPLGHYPPTLGGASLVLPSLGSPSELPWNRRIVEFSVPLRPRLLWYFVHDGRPDGSGYFTAYDPKTKLCVGDFGSKGFRSERPPTDEWLPVDGRLMLKSTAFNGNFAPRGIMQESSRSFLDAEVPPTRSYMISGRRLLEIDFAEHSIRSVLEAQGLMAVNITERAADPSSPLLPQTPPKLRRYLALRAPDRVMVIDPHGDERRTYMLPEEVRRRSFTFYELSDQTALVLASSWYFRENKYRLFWIDPAGKVLRREEVIGFERIAWFEPTTRTWVDAVAMPAPVALAALFATELAAWIRGPGEEMSDSEAVAAAFAVGWPALAAIVVLSAGLTILVWRRQQRYAARGTTAWMGFVLLGGVPALLAYRFHRRWPVMEACPACGHRVPRDRDACVRCDAEFPAPAVKGTEVFAGAAVEAGQE